MILIDGVCRTDGNILIKIIETLFGLKPLAPSLKSEFQVRCFFMREHPGANRNGAILIRCFDNN